jgi:hypothetical protein
VHTPPHPVPPAHDTDPLQRPAAAKHALTRTHGIAASRHAVPVNARLRPAVVQAPSCSALPAPPPAQEPLQQGSHACVRHSGGPTSSRGTRGAAQRLQGRHRAPVIWLGQLRQGRLLQGAAVAPRRHQTDGCHAHVAAAAVPEREPAGLHARCERLACSCQADQRDTLSRTHARLYTPCVCAYLHCLQASCTT